jgi:DNA polymerase-4
MSIPNPTDDVDTIASVAKELLLSTSPEGQPTRLLGISLSNFNETIEKSRYKGGSWQLELF